MLNILRHPRLLVIAEILLWSVLAIQVARFTWPLFTATVPSFKPLAMPSADLVPLAGHDPFFSGVLPTVQADGDGWQVFGVRLSASGSSAILANGTGPQQAFRVGDEIATGLVLAAVAADHVMLRQTNQTRRVDLPRAPAPTATATTTPSSAPAKPSATPQASAKPPVAEVHSDVDPGKLIAEAGLRMTMDAGRMSGYTLLPRGNDALLRAAGLQPGDVLVSVNGQALDPERLAELAGQLRSNPRAEIAYRRDGQLHTVTLGSGKP